MQIFIVIIGIIMSAILIFALIWLSLPAYRKTLPDIDFTDTRYEKTKKCKNKEII